MTGALTRKVLLLLSKYLFSFLSASVLPSFGLNESTLVNLFFKAQKAGPRHLEMARSPQTVYAQ